MYLSKMKGTLGKETLVGHLDLLYKVIDFY